MKKKLVLIIIFFSAAIGFSFKRSMTEQDWLLWTNKCLAQSYNAATDAKLKKFEFSVSADAFVRLRKTYAKGKEEYYSFSLHKLGDMDYYGSTATGTLQLKTLADDIIVQTRNDRKGDVDSMTTVLNVPVKNMEPERLDSLREAFDFLKAKGL